MSDENVTPFPGRKRPPLTERVLQLVQPSLKGCQHRSFVLDERLARVVCGDCGEHLDPLWCLRELSKTESQFHRMRDRYNQEMTRLAARSRTRCQHCGKQTRISES